MRRTLVILALLLSTGAATTAHAQVLAASADERYQALVGLARVRRNAGDMAGARRYFEEARRARPFDRQELTEYFWVLAGQDSAAALATGREILAASPDAHDVRDRVISEAIALKDETTVRTIAGEGAGRQSVALWPRRTGESFLREGRPAEAAEAYARAVKAGDATVEDRAGLAVSLESAKRYAESAAAWRAVPAGARAARPDWEKSRLRAIANGTAPAEAATELKAWLATHTDDEATREMLVDVWMRAKHPKEALAVLTPAPAGPAGTRWIRRRLAIATASNLPEAGVTAIDELVARGEATAADKRQQAGLFVDMRHYDKAASTVQALAPKSGKCDVQLLAVADRLPDPTGTTVLSAMMTRPDCAAPASWIRRGAERHVAVSDHQAALKLLKTLPVSELEKPEMVRLAGQVHAWTGDLPEGIRLLELAVKTKPEDRAAQQTLAEARQALYHPPVTAPAPLRVADPRTLTAEAPVERVEAPAVAAPKANEFDALRLQARQAGWKNHYALARRLYAELETKAPNDAAIAAEAAAKSAFYAGRWRAAADAYAHWISLEPTALEAHFEYAESLRADGRINEANAALDALMAMGQHDHAGAAKRRAAQMRGPAITLVTNGKSADGYEGQRLLELSEYGGALRTTFGSDDRFAVSGQATRVRARGDVSTTNGYAGSLAASAAFSPAFAMDARVTVWDLAASGKGIVDATARFAWRPVDRWTLAFGARQDPLFENMTTVDRGLTAAGGFLAATFESPRTWFNLQVAQQSVSDGNDRTRATMTVSRALSDRLRHVRLVGWAESLRYQSASTDYFSPSHQLRADVGLEYTLEFRGQQFRGDRRQAITFGYLIGTDDDETTYHHPLMRFSYEVASGWAFDANASWIRSDVYNETSAFIGLRWMK